MIKQIFFVFGLLVTMITVASGQTGLKLEQLPVATQTKFKGIAGKYRTGQVDYQSVENNLKNSGINFSNMPIEDAVMMMFMLIAEDARNDTKDMLEEMNKTRKKKDAIREAERLMKKELDSLRNQARSAYGTDSTIITKKVNEKQTKLFQLNNREKEANAAELKASGNKDAVEKHLQSVELAIEKLKQSQSPKRKQ